MMKKVVVGWLKHFGWTTLLGGLAGFFIVLYFSFAGIDVTVSSIASIASVVLGAIMINDAKKISDEKDADE